METKKRRRPSTKEEEGEKEYKRSRIERLNNEEGEKSALEGTRFLISSAQTNRKGLERLIKKHGGEVVTNIAKFKKDLKKIKRKQKEVAADGNTFIVQDYNVDEEDESIGEFAKEYGLPIVCPDFLSCCVRQGRVVDVYKHAAGAFCEDDTMADESLKSFFAIPSTRFNVLFKETPPEAREEVEQPQSFPEFCKTDRSPSPDKEKRIIYVLPLGVDLTPSKSYIGPTATEIEDFLKAFFRLEVKVLPKVKIVKKKGKCFQLHIGDYFYPIRTRYNKGSGIYRMHAMDIIDVMTEVLAEKEDGFLLVALTGEDIYDGEDKKTGRDKLILEKADMENDVVTGRATGNNCAVVSMFGFDPKNQQKEEKEERKGKGKERKKERKKEKEEQENESDKGKGKDREKELRKESEEEEENESNKGKGKERKKEENEEEKGKDKTEEKRMEWVCQVLMTLVHELSHAIGIDHCAYYSCLMNANVVGLEDSTFFYCPIDLRKAHHCFQFDLKERYTTLTKFFTSLGRKREIEWIENRLKGII